VNSTVIARSVAASPVRSASDTWKVIVSIIVPDPKDPARDELTRISGIGASIVAAESPKEDAIVVYGGGPRLRVYCLYNEDAQTGERSEDSVRQKVTEDGWKMSLPCEEDDFDWISRQLAAITSKVSARKLGTDVPADADDEKKNAPSKANAVIDLKEFFKS